MDDEDDTFLAALNEEGEKCSIPCVIKPPQISSSAPKKKKKKSDLSQNKKRKSSVSSDEFVLTDREFSVVMDLLEKESFALRYFNPLVGQKSVGGFSFSFSFSFLSR